MVTPSDIESLKRILKTEAIPDDILREVSMRTVLFHRDGNSGSLKTLALIEAVRFLGYEPQFEEPKAPVVDWRTIPGDGSFRVEARFNGAWMPGVFLGLVEHGTCAVRLDDDEFVRECRPDMVRIEGQEPKAADLVEDRKVRTKKEKKIEQPAPTRKVHTEDKNGDPVIDWAAVVPGDEFYAEVDGDYVESKLVSQDGDEVVVLVGEEEKRVKKVGLVFAKLASV